MSAMQRSKGHRGEREVCELIRQCTGFDAKRRVRQHGGDSDIEGVPGWSIEVKNCAKATLGDVERWWAQAVEQAGENMPVLIYKRQRGEWRAVWPLAEAMTPGVTSGLIPRAAATIFEWTAETSVEAWASANVEPADAPDLAMGSPILGNGQKKGNQ